MPYYQTRVVGRGGHPALQVHWLEPDDCKDEASLKYWVEEWAQREHGHREWIEYGIALVPDQFQNKWKLVPEHKRINGRVLSSKPEYEFVIGPEMAVRVYEGVRFKEDENPNWYHYYGWYCDDPDIMEPNSKKGFNSLGSFRNTTLEDAKKKALDKVRDHLEKLVEYAEDHVKRLTKLHRLATDVTLETKPAGAAPSGAKYHEPKR